MVSQIQQKQRLEPYLRVQLTPDTQAVISMKQLQEVIVVGIERITPIPNMSDWVIGLLNQRSQVFWLIDLSELLELSPLDPDLQEYNVAIVREGDIPMGLVVQKVQGVVRLSSDSIQSPIGAVLPGIEPYLRGCILHQQYGILLVLDAAAIINSQNPERKI